MKIFTVSFYFVFSEKQLEGVTEEYLLSFNDTLIRSHKIIRVTSGWECVGLREFLKGSALRQNY